MKKIGTSIYMHKSYLYDGSVEDFLPTDLIAYLLTEFDNFDVIKYDKKNDRCSMIKCLDFDSEREPTLLKVDIINRSPQWWVWDKNISYTKPNKPIYHHKWMFVPSNYEGFDIEESKAWSKQWEECAVRSDKHKIGYIERWKEFLSKNNLPEDVN